MVMNRNGGTAWIDVAQNIQDRPCLSDEYIQRLAQAAIMIERYDNVPRTLNGPLTAKAISYPAVKAS